MSNSHGVDVQIDTASIRDELMQEFDGIFSEIASDITAKIKVPGAYFNDTKESKETGRGGHLRDQVQHFKSKFGIEGGHIVYADAYHAHLVEFGHDLTVEKDGTVVKHIPNYVRAKSYLRKAKASVTRRIDQMLKENIGGVTRSRGNG